MNTRITTYSWPILVGQIVCLFIIAMHGSADAISVSNQEPVTHLKGESLSPPCVQSLFGVCYGSINEGLDPIVNGTINETQIRDRLSVLGSGVRWIRTYSCGDYSEKIGEISHQMGIKVVAGAWIGKNLTQNEDQIQKLINLGRSGDADVLAVGNEALLRGDVTADQLKDYIWQVKKAVPNMTVTTVETFKNWRNNPELVDEVDAVYANIYPLYAGVRIDKEVGDLKQSYRAMQKVSKGKSVVISETGFPSAGETIGSAVPSIVNANRYFREVSNWSNSENIPVLYFKLYDDEKEGKGIFYHNGTLKLSFCKAR
jgi:exo-beta-1,3-glucanase (GH17 family)